jgi:hypothetical protein
MKIGENGKVHTDLIKNGEFIISWAIVSSSWGGPRDVTRN